MKRVLIALGLMVLVCSPFYGRSWVLFGNPLYPFLDWDILTSGTVQADVQAECAIDSTSMLRDFRILPGQWDRLLYRMFIEDSAPWVRQAGKPTDMGPVPVICLILFLVGMSRCRLRGPVAAVVVVGIGYWVWWIVGVRIWEARYIMPTLTVLCALAGAGTAWLWGSRNGS